MRKEGQRHCGNMQGHDMCLIEVSLDLLGVSLGLFELSPALIQVSLDLLGVSLWLFELSPALVQVSLDLLEVSLGVFEENPKGSHPSTLRPSHRARAIRQAARSRRSPPSS